MLEAALFDFRQAFLCLLPKCFELGRRQFFKRARRHLLHHAEAAAEAQIAVAQRHLRIHAEMSAEINHGEEQVPQLSLDTRVARFGFGREFGGLFGNFGQQFAPTRPIEAGFLRLGAKLGRFSQRRKRAENAIEPRGRLLLAPKARPLHAMPFPRL